MADELTRRALFREVNTRICEIDSGFGTAGAGYHVLCECGRPDCFERLRVPASVYDGIRALDDRFVVATGHQREDETVVSIGLMFDVVESGASSKRLHSPRAAIPEPA
jgi:hypothetical protein